MTERRKSNIGGPAKRFKNSKVKFLSSKDVISLNTGTVKRCIKTTTTSVAPLVQTAPPTGASTPTQTSMVKKRLLSSEKMLFGKPASASSSGCKEIGHKWSILEDQLPYHLAPIAWKGSLEVHDLAGNTIVELVAYLPLRVSSKLCNAVKALPTRLYMKMVRHCNAWPRHFMDFPNLDDVGVYFRPSERSSSLKWTHLLRQLDSRKHALKMDVKERLEFVVHSSQFLVENSQKIGGNFFLWGFFWKHKMSGSRKKKPDITASKTSSELGASPEFRTPIALDKTADLPKRKQMDKEVTADTSDVCDNNLLEKEVVADTFDVPPGLSGPSIGQELSPMDGQSETSMRGKETQSTYKEDAPGCSPISHIADKESDSMQIFSTIGVGMLEEACKNLEEYPEAPRLTDPSQVKVKHEKDLLIPLPVGLEIPPGFSIEVETRKEKSISNRKLESPPCFHTLGQVLIKQEKERMDQQPGGLDTPPGFIRSIETREENNISDECKDSSLPRTKGIVHQQTSAGQRTVVFSYPMIQGTTAQSYSAQLTNPGQKAIQDVSLSHSQTIPMMAQRQNENRCLSAAPHNANARARISVPYHFRVLNSPFLASNPTDAYHPSIKETSDITATARGGASQRETARQSPLFRRETRSRSPVPLRERSRSRSPVPIRERSCSRSPQPRRHRSRSRSTVLRRLRSQSRSPVPIRERSQSRSPHPRRHRSRSRSPVLRWRRSQSRSPVPRWHRSRSRSPVPRWHGSRSRGSSRWYHNPVYGWNGSQGRSPVRPCNLHDSGRYSQYGSRYRSRSRGDIYSFDYSPERR